MLKVNFMKKIGIITFHCADNFGAVLQVYSLQKTIELMGYNPEIIDFRPYRLTKNYSLFVDFKKSLEEMGFLRTTKKMLIRIKNFKENYTRKNNFNHFRNKYLNLSSNTFLTSSELIKRKPLYDYYITGSDQVWNPRFFSDIGESYFLDFAVIDSIKIAYAASIANQIEKDYIDVFRRNLERFDYISVREESAKKTIDKLTEKKVHVTLDPTLLTTEEEWRNISTFNFSTDKYILVYDLVKDPVLISIANRIANQTGYKIISYSSKKGYNNWHSSFSTLNPTEFLGLFDKAEFVITSSFHGTVFSVIFNKPFYTVPHPTRGSRMIDFLNELNLKERIIQNENDDIDFHTVINYESVNKKVSKLRKDSIEFLSNALEIK